MKRLHYHLHRAFTLAVCGFAFLVSACHKGGGSGSASKTEEGEFVLEEGRYLLPQSVQKATVSITMGAQNLLTLVIDVAQVVNGMWVAQITDGSYFDGIGYVKFTEGKAYQIESMDNDVISLNIDLRGLNGEIIEIKEMDIRFTQIMDESRYRTGRIESCNANYISPATNPYPSEIRFKGMTVSVTFS